MSFRIQLRLIGECEDCGRCETAQHDGGFLGGTQVEEDEVITEFLFDLEFGKSWNVERVSYEDVELRCPKCKQKREAA